MPVHKIDSEAVQQVLASAAAEVLETMFFTSLADEGEEPATADGPSMCASLAFCGTTSGRLGVRLPLETARQMATAFLGLEEEQATDAQAGEVVCELCNMVCGSVLSGLESGSTFELRHPELGPPDTGCARSGEVTSRILALEDGVFEVWLERELTA
jgi:CheY-specific phosphatase CheX